MNSDIPSDRGPDFTPENEAADERRMFNGAREPMRALRDLIALCELTMGVAHGGERAEQDILERAQDAFTTIRELFGDTRLAEDIGDSEQMPEPSADFREAFQMTAGGLQYVARLLPGGESHAVRFTGKWAGFAPQTIEQILDRANAALEPKAEC
jgi:hypothetical protein